ncbi:MAG: metalloregulator ArsR/SmtB family transcription factor [Acidimicrobiales bacterium]
MSTDAVFTALADDTRRSLLRAVAAHGPCTATELARDRDITRQAVAKHLAVLGEAGLVHGRREGREVRYRADTTPLDLAARWIDETGDAWDRRLERLRAVLE